MPDPALHPDPAPSPPLWTTSAAPPDRIARQLGLDGAGHATLIQLAGGTLLTGYALALGATPAFIALLAAVPLALRLVQLAVSWRVERSGHWRRTALHGALLARLPWLLAALLPWLPLPPSLQLPLLLAVVMAAAVGSAIFDVALLTWLSELIPPVLRGWILGRRVRLMGLVGVAVSLAGAAAVDAAADRGWGTTAPLAALVALGSVASLLSLLPLARLPEPRRTTSRRTAEPWLTSLVEPLRDASGRRLALFVAIWGLGLGLAAPFFAVYLLAVLDLSFTSVVALGALGTGAAALSAPGWGRLSDHFGARPVLRSATYLFVLSAAGWLLVTPDRQWPLVPLHLAGGLAAGAFDTPLSTLILRLAPAPRRASWLAVVSTTFALTQALAPLLGSALLAALGGIAAPRAWLALVAVSLVLRALATPLLGRIEEPEHRTVGHLIRTMGRVRTLGTSLPLDPLVRPAYGHLARLADFVTGEPSSPAPPPRPPSDAIARWRRARGTRKRRSRHP